VTVELTRRLIESGVPLADLEAALLLVVQRGMTLPEALAVRDPGLRVRVEQELARSEVPTVLTVRVSPELYERLPEGMCRRLLAVPVHVDPRSGRVDVAAVEPLDPHVLQEFAFHLEQPVRVLLASHAAVTAALERLQRGTKLSILPPQRPPGSEAPIPLVKADASVASDAPIPLIRRSLLPERGPKPRSRPPAGALPETEGVALSWRSKPPPLDLVAGAERERRAAAEARVAEELAAGPSARELLEEAATPERVLDVLRDALTPAACILFAVKSGSFDGRVASQDIQARADVKALSLLSHQPSVLETAVKSGFYLGPVPNTPNHRELRDALPPDSAHEVYVTVVTVGERPSLVWLLTGFERSLDLTRRADELALVAGRALGRILRQRKRGG
jgi:Type II secretion system (T2SS), protein E, N-terminal domain